MRRETQNKKGYVSVPKPSWFTGRKNSDYVYLHHLVFCEKAGLTEVPRGYHVHHIDGNARDNSPNNLALVNMSGRHKLNRFLGRLSYDD